MKRNKSYSSGQPPKKKQRIKLPPPPNSVIPNIIDKNLSLSKEERDNKFKGRSRIHKHVPGNYPTHVYIPVLLDPNNPNDKITLCSLYEYIHKIIPIISSHKKEFIFFESFKNIMDYDSFDNWILSLIEPLELHISLSRLCMLKQDQRISYFNHIQDSILKNNVSPFTLEFRDFKFLENDDKTTVFLSIISDFESLGYDNIQNLYNYIDITMEYFNFSKYYDERICHFSIGWYINNGKDITLENNVKNNNIEIDYLELSINSIECKIGNRIQKISFHS